MTFQKILIAVDEGPVAAHAVTVGTELAKALNAEVAFVNVVEIEMAASGDSGISPTETMALLERDARRLLATCAESARLRAQPLQFVVFGKPGHEILKTAEEWAADLIVIGTHGRAGVSHLLLGSVAESVVRRARCPVLTVRPPS
jgi:nucleotide-binding universal stress UspA family protein